MAAVTMVTTSLAWFNVRTGVQKELEIATEKVQYLIFEADTLHDFSGEDIGSHTLYPAKAKKRYLHDNKLLDDQGNLIELDVFDDNAEYLEGTANKISFFEELEYFGYDTETVDFTYFASTVGGSYLDAATHRLSANDVAVDVVIYKRIDLDSGSWVADTYYTKSDDASPQSIDDIYLLSDSYDEEANYYQRTALGSTQSQIEMGPLSDVGVYCEVYFANVDELIDYTVFNRKLFIYVKASINEFYLFAANDNPEQADQLLTSEPLQRNEENTRWKEYTASVNFDSATDVYVANNLQLGNGLQFWGYAGATTSDACKVTVPAGRHTLYFSPDYLYNNGQSTHLIVRDTVICNATYNEGNSHLQVEMYYDQYDSSLGEGASGARNVWYVDEYFPSGSAVTLTRGGSSVASFDVKVGGRYVVTYDGANLELTNVSNLYRYYLYTYDSATQTRTYIADIEFVSAENNVVSFAYSGVLPQGNYRIYDVRGYAVASGAANDIWLTSNGYTAQSVLVQINLGGISPSVPIGTITVTQGE